MSFCFPMFHESLILYHSAWTFYDVLSAEMAAMRTSLLLKVAVIDLQPFEILLDKQLSSQSWEVRYVSIAFELVPLSTSSVAFERLQICSRSLWIFHTPLSQSKASNGGLVYPKSCKDISFACGQTTMLDLVLITEKWRLTTYHWVGSSSACCKRLEWWTDEASFWSNVKMLGWSSCNISSVRSHTTSLISVAA